MATSTTAIPNKRDPENEPISGSPRLKKARVDVEERGEAESEEAHAEREEAETDRKEEGQESHEEEEEEEEEEEKEQEEEEEDEDLDRPMDGRRSVGGNTMKDGPPKGYSDLYLDTINRMLLDFDFEKLCSVSLSHINVYACLICGKYFQGRGTNTHAYFHALDESHHVFINMSTARVYVLPEGYEVHNRTLDDIKYVVNPTYTKEEVAKLDTEYKVRWDLSGRKYVPGFVGLNNIKQNDYLNVVVHALAHVPPLRNYFMLEDLSDKPELVQRFSTLIRKIWNSKAFKSHVSPHELLQEISLRSSKRFTLTKQSDPIDFLSWFLNNLHTSLGGSHTKPGSSIIQKVFQGKLKVESQKITAKADESGDRLRFIESEEVKTDIVRYLMLTLDLPPPPLFQDELEKNIIPQVPLTTILAKYDGRKTQELLGHRKRYRLMHPLPPFLTFHIKRFSKNKFVAERNPTIVTFPVRSLDIAPYVEPAEGTTSEPIWYDLAANITHESVDKGAMDKPGAAGQKQRGVSSSTVAGEEMKSVWRVQVRDRSREEGWGQWVQIQDLWVEEVRRETLFLGESYIQIWERRRGTGGKARGRRQRRRRRGWRRHRERGRDRVGRVGRRETVAPVDFAEFFVSMRGKRIILV
ncbi:hypothetical protein BDZ91DRAFT_192558 [Kalaharituber pfeilii]|nr:hypothetical protein BDZ91DRAFT_192558 [Kalaharituber pfeilii]